MGNLGKATMDHVLFWYYDLKKNITLSTRWKTRLHKHWDINAFYSLKTDCNDKSVNDHQCTIPSDRGS